jgi:uncharacterized membrane protein
MVANVAHIIIPGQRRMVEALAAGRAPDPKDGAAGKSRKSMLKQCSRRLCRRST